MFEDGTDIYWARSRVVEYLQTIAGRLPANVHPAIGPDATGAGWVYEYALVDHSHKHSLADLRSIQDWHLRYQLATVPGVAEVASIGGFVRQYQVNVDPNKLLAYGIPLSTVIDRVKSSTNEVGGRVLELSGTRYMVRGLGYLKSLDDLAKRARHGKERNARAHQGSGHGFLRPGHPRRRSGVERRRRDRGRHCGHAVWAECSQRNRWCQEEAG